MTKEIFQIMAERQAAGKSFAVATVVETRGSVSAKTGAKAVIDADGTMVAGWVGGGCAESSTREAAIKCIETGQTTVLDIDLDDEMLGAGMPCGGSMRVYIEPILPKPTLWIMGHGRIAECLCLLGDLLGFNVVVNDSTIAREQYPAAARLITDDVHYDQLTPQPRDFVVIATQHKGDHESMRRTLASHARYIALIASRKRSKLVMEYLREEGFPQTELDRVRAPAGLDLGAKTPEEIALSVMSEMVSIRRQGSGLPMREKLQAGGKPVKSQAAG